VNCTACLTVDNSRSGCVGMIVWDPGRFDCRLGKVGKGTRAVGWIADGLHRTRRELWRSRSRRGPMWCFRETKSQEKRNAQPGSPQSPGQAWHRVRSFKDGKVDCAFAMRSRWPRLEIGCSFLQAKVQAHGTPVASRCTLRCCTFLTPPVSIADSSCRIYR
jgi:hypothetical protein